MLGIEGHLHNQVLLFDLVTLETRKLRAHRCAECRGGPCQRIRALAPSQLDNAVEVQFATLDDAIAAGYTLIDVRDETEIREAPLEQVHWHIPAASVLARADDFSRDTKSLLICARGIRSRAAAQALRDRGLKNIYSLSGGMIGLKSHAPS